MQKLFLAAALAGAIACSPPANRCGTEICTAEQRCTPELTCVTDGKPVISIESPADMTAVTGDMIEVKGTAKDDEKPPVVEVAFGPVWFPAKVGADGAFTVTVRVPKLDSTATALTARARDSKKQEATATRTLNVDNVPPECRLEKPATGGFTNSPTTLAVSLRASDGSQQLVNPRFSTDGAMTFATPPGTGGLFDFNWVLPTENGGAHDLVFRVDDPSGHTCEATATILVDNVKPTAGFTMPSPGALLGVPFFTAGGRIAGNASDGARVLKSVTLDFADSAGPRPATLVGTTWSVAVPVPTGDDYKARVATVVATDLADNTATASLMVTVDVKPPVLAITNPSGGAKLNVTHFPTTNNVPLTWTLTDGDPQLNIGILTADGGFLSPPVLPTSSTDNPKTYQPVLRANDRAGNVSTASVTFTVDRVFPTVTTFIPANNTRMHPGIVTGDFSEPMMGGAGLSLNPQVAGVWTTPSRFEVSALAKDSVYSVTTGMTDDLHGNPVIPVNFRFHTETVVPASGALLGTGYREVLAAAADAEGTLNILASLNTNSTVDWIQFNSRTGLSSVVDNYPTTLLGNLVATRTVQADLSSRRVAGLWFVSGGTTNNVRYNINGGGHITVANGWALIPTPAFAGEGAALGEVGVIVGGVYKRAGRADLPINLTGVSSVGISDTRWELVEHVSGGTRSQSFGCVGSCSQTAVKPLGGAGVGIPNSASSRSCSIHGYLNATTEMTTLFKWQPGCGSTCAPDINELNNFDQVTADPAVDGTFYGFNNIGGGQYQIKRRVLSSANCAGAITNVGNPISLGVLIGQPRIVVLRGQVGLIFADSSYLMRFITP